MIPNTLKNFNLYADGESLISRCPTVKLPELTPITEEEHVAGQLAPQKMRLGVAMSELQATLAGVDAAVFKHFGITESARITWTLRGAVRSAGGVRAVVADVTGLIAKADPGTWAMGKKTNGMVNVEPRRFRVRDNGEEVLFVDLDNYVLRRAGVDELEAERAAIGL